MNLLIILLVFTLGLVIFGLLFYGVAKLVLHQKMRNQKKKYSHINSWSARYKAGNLYYGK